MQHFFFYNSILILGMLILAIKESLHFFHTQLPMTITSNGISSPIYHPFCHLYLQSLFSPIFL